MMNQKHGYNALPKVLRPVVGLATVAALRSIVNLTKPHFFVCCLVPPRYPALRKRIEAEQAAVWANQPDDKKDDVARTGAFGGRNTYGPLLVMLKADKQAVLVTKQNHL